MVLAKLKACSLLFNRRADCTKYTYDDEGNLIQKVSVGGPTATWTYDYDVNNRLTSIVHTGGGNELYRTTYSYDVFNRRIKEVEDADGAGGGSSVETRFSYDRDKIWADLDSGNALKVRYLRDDDDGSLFTRVKANGYAAWYYTDVWGSTRQMVDGSGAVGDTIGYDGFGNIMSETNAAFGDRWKWRMGEFNSTNELALLSRTFYIMNIGQKIGHHDIFDPLLTLCAPAKLILDIESHPNPHEPVEVYPKGKKLPQSPVDYKIEVYKTIVLTIRSIHEGLIKVSELDDKIKKSKESIDRFKKYGKTLTDNDKIKRNDDAIANSENLVKVLSKQRDELIPKIVEQLINLQDLWRGFSRLPKLFQDSNNLRE